jgi:hypothetical protein
MEEPTMARLRLPGILTWLLLVLTGLARSGDNPASTSGRKNVSGEAKPTILVNPIYAGVGPFPRLVEDAAWVRAGARLIEEEGADQFLVNLLYVLRECFQGEATA